MSDSAAGYQSVVFGVNDPAQFDEIVAGLKQNDAIDWRAFKVETNNKTYKAAAAPLEKYQSLITTVLILIVAVSIVVLSLILTMWAKKPASTKRACCSQLESGKQRSSVNIWRRCSLSRCSRSGCPSSQATSSQARSATVCCRPGAVYRRATRAAGR